MTQTLIVMRHAKSSWGDPSLPDHDRPLNDRGHRSAPAIGQWLKDQNAVPDLILSSSARRTKETCAGLGFECDVIYDRCLYLAMPETLLKVLRGAKGQTIMLLGHNPGVAEFAESILVSPPAHPQFQDFPTAATLVCDVETSWSDLTWHCARQRAFAVPRELV